MRRGKRRRRATPSGYSGSSAKSRYASSSTTSGGSAPSASRNLRSGVLRIIVGAVAEDELLGPDAEPSGEGLAQRVGTPVGVEVDARRLARDRGDDAG